MKNLQMVDLKGQYNKIKDEVDAAISATINSTRYIGGPEVSGFAEELESYLDSKHVIPCANGTDALQVALMALGLQPGDEVIVPAFTYVATAEVIALLQLKPVMVDVEYDSYNMNVDHFAAAITSKTKAVVPVHLFGQGSHMASIMKLADEKGIYVIEDNAQAIGAKETLADGTKKSYGTFGQVGTTSFFPSKNLGCYGDGGAIFCQDDDLAVNIRQVANHGQSRRYYHDRIGVNSRLDSLQAAILRIKLRHLDEYCAARVECANYYDNAFSSIDWIDSPHRVSHSNHVFHQYVFRVKNGMRDRLKAHLDKEGIPNNIYYPVPLYKQKAFSQFTDVKSLEVTERLCDEVLALPIHTEMTDDILQYIVDKVLSFAK